MLRSEGTARSLTGCFLFERIFPLPQLVTARTTAAPVADGVGSLVVVRLDEGLEDGTRSLATFYFYMTSGGFERAGQPDP